MLDFQRVFHTGLLVHDLEEGMAQYGEALNLEWAKPFTFEALPLWTPGTGLQHLRLEVTYSTRGPQHLEIMIGPKGSFYDPDLGIGFHHVGYWVDDVREEVQGMQHKGWSVVAAGDVPEEGWGTFVYLTPPGGGLVVEFVSTSLMPALNRWWNGADTLA